MAQDTRPGWTEDQRRGRARSGSKAEATDWLRGNGLNQSPAVEPGGFLFVQIALVKLRGGLRSAVPLSSPEAAALFLTGRTHLAVRPNGHSQPAAPRNPPVPFTPLGFRQSLASKLPEPRCGRSRMGFPIGTITAIFLRILFAIQKQLHLPL